MANLRKARVLVVDGEPVSRCGLVYLLNSHERLCVVAEAETLPHARELCERHQPELVVLDSSLGDGLAFIAEVKRFSPEGRVVVFTAQADALSVARAYRAGAVGYVTRRDSIPALMGAVIGALEGDRQLAPCVQRVLMDQLICGGMEVRGGTESMLSDRELQIFRLRGKALKTSAIASELRISVKTVETHLQRIKSKLNLSSGAELQERAMLFQDAGSGLRNTGGKLARG